MRTIEVKNVNEVLPLALQMLAVHGKEISPRGILTLEPVTTTYLRPCERVMLVPERDANPFFHLMEALWILQGRQDVAWLTQFNKNMELYSDDGAIFHAPYGQRLRHQQGFDQIRSAINLLIADKDTRQCVMQIWDASCDLGIKSKDIPCNDLIFLKIRDNKLNMTVCNRSNDVIWGAYGANVVQFSMIQEYIAGKVGVKVGVYNQVSDSFHVYPDNPQFEALVQLPYTDFNPYKYEVTPYPLATWLDGWDDELALFCSMVDPDPSIDSAPILSKVREGESMFQIPFFVDVAIPMYNCWIGHKISLNGLMLVDSIKASDWRLAATQWLTKREQVND